MNQLLTREQYWDRAAEKKEFTTPFQVELFRDVVAKEACILDIGCGYGRTLSQLDLCGFHNSTGVDIAEGMIKRGKKLFPGLSLEHIEDCGKIPFADNSFDTVILLAVLTCIIDDLEQEQLIREINRVLKKDGIIYMNDFLINSDQRNVDRYTEFEPKYNKYGIFELQEEKRVALRHYTKARIDELIVKFEKIVFEPVVYKTMNGNQSNGFYYMGRKI